MNSRDLEAQLRPGVLRRDAHLLAGGQLRAAVRQGPAVRRSWNRAVDAVAGGWSLSFAVTAHRGFPITVTDSPTRRCRRRARPSGPNRIGSGEVDNPTLERWIDRAAFVSAPLGQFGNSGIGILRAPGYWNVDLSFSKRIATFGRQYLMFRGEVFNALNHPNFGPPNANIQSTAFGTITSTVGDARIVQLALKYSF